MIIGVIAAAGFIATGAGTISAELRYSPPLGDDVRVERIRTEQHCELVEGERYTAQRYGRPVVERAARERLTVLGCRLGTQQPQQHSSVRGERPVGDGSAGRRG